MKTMRGIVWVAGCLVVAEAVLAGAAFAGTESRASATTPTATASGENKPIERIGTYDSRAVAVSFAGSENFAAWMKELHDAHAQARAKGDKEQVASLEEEGARRQRQFHLQGFGTAPVDDILARYEARLPAMKKRLKVDALVSKWDEETLAKHPKAERVDVTMELIDLIDPNERQRQYAIQIQKKKPVSRERIEGAE